MDPDPDPDWPPSGSTGSGSVKNEYGPETLLGYTLLSFLAISVADPDPHLFGPPGSGSSSQRYGSESGSFYHRAKIVRKTLIPSSYYFVTLLDFLSLKNYVNIPSKSNEQKKIF